MENDDYIDVETALLQMHMLGQSQAVHACLNTNKLLILEVVSQGAGHTKIFKAQKFTDLVEQINQSI